MDKQKSIESLQFFVTHLAEGAIVHKQQDLYWSQGAVELIEKIGTQNWLLLQL